MCACIPKLFNTKEKTNLCASDKGPIGEADSSLGELPNITSWSKLFESFLSRPASLPVGRQGGQHPREGKQ